MSITRRKGSPRQHICPQFLHLCPEPLVSFSTLCARRKHWSGIISRAIDRLLSDREAHMGHQKEKSTTIIGLHCPRTTQYNHTGLFTSSLVFLSSRSSAERHILLRVSHLDKKETALFFVGLLCSCRRSVLICGTEDCRAKDCFQVGTESQHNQCVSADRKKCE